MTLSKHTFRSRFAPSPTGPLHLGSLVAAVGSYLEARSHTGQWLVRIEDIDSPRCKPEWADNILHTLEAFGFEWDEKPIFQSQRTPLYEAALKQLVENGVIYSCGCTRKEINDSSLQGIEGAVYPGTCRKGLLPHMHRRSSRVRTNDVIIAFKDDIQGEIEQDVEAAIGDFVIKRADGLIAYQLAVVVDDAEQNISHVIRGVDLLLSTPRQIYLQNLLELPTPHYAHLPIIVNAKGEKLSKQTGAKALDSATAPATLSRCLTFLNHPPPKQLLLKELWQWAMENWNLQKVQRNNISSLD